MILVLIWCDEEIESFEMESDMVLGYAKLVKNFGYVDSDGDEYKFRSAQMGTDKIFTIYLNSI